MSTVANLQRLSAATLSKLLLAEQQAAAAAATSSSSSKSNLVVVDVRDQDYVGGHIKGSKNVPFHIFDATLPTLVRQLRDADTVVFHCALSQQRGPSAALRYLRERDRLLLLPPDKSDPDPEPKPSSTAAAAAEQEQQQQQVYVLDRGFVGWQEEYGEDERLTEGYRKELWKEF